MNEKHTILRGHDSFETAYIIADYPYGFRLRCKQAVWLEFKAGWGSRYCTRTTNPKVPGEIWNAPKKGTYYSGMTFLTRDESNGHISQAECGDWMNTKQLAEFEAVWGPQLDAQQRIAFDVLKEMTAKYEAELAARMAAPAVFVTGNGSEIVCPASNQLKPV